MRPGTFRSRPGGLVMTSPGASQLASYVRPSREHGGGHIVIPLCNGMLGDGYGRPIWTRHVYQPEMTRWHYDPFANTWRRF